MKIYDEVISKVLMELDSQHSMYQTLYSRFYGKQDEMAKHIYEELTKICKLIRREITSQERK